jgi:hypothetical protein
MEKYGEKMWTGFIWLRTVIRALANTEMKLRIPKKWEVS